MDSLKNYFGYAETISDVAFDIMSDACGKDDRIGVVARIDVGEETIHIKTSDNPKWRSFDTELFYHAVSAILNEDNKYYMDDIEHLEQYIKKFSAELTEAKVGENCGFGAQQM